MKEKYNSPVIDLMMFGQQDVVRTSFFVDETKDVCEDDIVFWD